MFGVYALAQACIVVAYWAVFTLGCRIVGTRHAVLGVLLMVGVSAFTVPSPNFSPAVLAAPLWALALLHYWRAVGEGERGYWFLLALDFGLLLLSSYVGVLLLVTLVVFTLASPRGQRALLAPEPWLGLVLFAIVVFPHAAWLAQMRDLVLSGLNDSVAAAGRMSPWLWLAMTLLLTHLGLALLVAVASGWPRKRHERAPEIVRNPVQGFARLYVYVFALVPAGSGRSTASRRWWCCRGSRSWSRPATRCSSIASACCRRPGSACWWRRRRWWCSASRCCRGR
jgi:4-amino-4-deoxy-L-arabinose transferase-like glycosyltransferase